MCNTSHENALGRRGVCFTRRRPFLDLLQAELKDLGCESAGRDVMRLVVCVVRAGGTYKRLEFVFALVSMNSAWIALASALASSVATCLDLL